MAGDPLKKGRYTKFGNKIGLYNTKDGNFISNTPEVVLNFPFKDAVLEAGMTKEDAGRDERFLNIEMDGKDIDALEDPKVLTNFKYIDTDGEKALDENSDIEFFDENGDLKQNLLIKGNNLLALYTLREKLTEKVKLIYIDPPYNTGNDGFRYNDNFNHSSWLVFMKNRLEVARDLLSKKGLIYIQCDDNEQAYLKVLMDEVFGIENCVNVIAVNMSTPSGAKITHAISGKRFPKTKEYILLYAKNKDSASLHIPKVNKSAWDTEYNKIIPEWQREDFAMLSELSEDEINNRVKDMHLMSLTDFAKENHIDLTDDWKWANAYRIFAAEQNESLRKIAKDKDFDGDIGCVTSSQGKVKIITTRFNRDSSRARIELVSAEENGKIFISDNWIDMPIGGGISYEGGVQMLNGKKPEKLIERVISSGTDDGDLVLDYHLGSGTTAAVAHKMNRRWIGIEQMDYIETTAKKRLQKVINGEDVSGISPLVNWGGGGSFVYFELKKYNQDFIDRIMAAASIPELEEIYADMQKNAFLKFFFDKAEFEKDENFRNLDIYKRKEKLVDILDENQLYLNFDEINDGKYHVTPAEKELTNRFYQANEEDGADNGEE